MVEITRVLLVDDDPDIRMIGELSLSRVGGWETCTATSGIDALEQLAAGEHADVILLDMMMPGLDGLSTLQRMRAIPTVAPIPVLFMTAKVQRQEIAEYLAAGAQGVLPKPFDPMTLPAEIVKALS